MPVRSRWLGWICCAGTVSLPSAPASNREQRCIEPAAVVPWSELRCIELGPSAASCKNDVANMAFHEWLDTSPQRVQVCELAP